MGQRIKAKKNGFSSPIGAFIFLIVYDKMVIDYERGFSSPIGAFIFLIKSNEIFSYYDSNKFSSPIGAFIFLIKDLCYVEYSGNQVFVPYRGFYFLNGIVLIYTMLYIQFSSPIGAFIFLILVLQSLYLCGLKRCFAV